METIEFFNRHRNRLEYEKVYGEGFLRFTYANPLGALPLHAFVKRAAFSKWYGRRMDDPATRSKIGPFIETYGLDPSEFADPPESFPHFNAFFYRKLKPEARPIDTVAPAVFPADGRHFGFAEASRINAVFVKGQRFDLGKLLGDDDLASRFQHGSLVLSRLCPVDYHRFHFPCSGTPQETTLINGPLFSVSPIALRRKLSFLWENKRCLTKIETDDLGLVLMLEIGATCVGSIQQTFTPGQPVRKGDEKGYFAFGGSSTITLFERGAVQLSVDLLEHSGNRRELYARMGSPMTVA
ncbi:phosphatidylserine decarboxylase proenzyme [Haloferula helveola]|uniref:Phosphatidylserine decarboxylase proenzyme n=1 Tax=Haloferula helveola TaxID=490095 RepID=A0ABN6HB56_9BACT|nr:phosphatidylserine decarboxylase proenzyme [Haloferula helveola]